MKKTLKNFKLDAETIAALESLVGIRGKDQTDVIRTLVLAAAKRKPRKEKSK